MKNTSSKKMRICFKNVADWSWDDMCLQDVFKTCMLFFYISKGLSVGLRMCLMLAPGWEGLKGAWAP